MKKYKGHSFEVFSKNLKLPNGKVVNWDIIKMKKVAVIIPLIGSDILLNRQYRPPLKKWIYELPAGDIEENEKPILAAGRELEEETGYHSDKLEFVFKSYSSPGSSDELEYFFVAKDLRKTHQKLDKSEEIIVQRFSQIKTLEMIKKGKIIDGKTIQGILYCKNYLDK